MGFGQLQQFFINFISDVELNAISHWSHYIERKVSKKIFEEEAGNNKNTNQKKRSAVSMLDDVFNQSSVEPDNWKTDKR